jgi:hypothetical protein
MANAWLQDQGLVSLKTLPQTIVDDGNTLRHLEVSDRRAAISTARVRESANRMDLGSNRVQSRKTCPRTGSTARRLRPPRQNKPG